jgi:hypothetical protein
MRSQASKPTTSGSPLDPGQTALLRCCCLLHHMVHQQIGRSVKHRSLCQKLTMAATLELQVA